MKMKLKLKKSNTKLYLKNSSINSKIEEEEIIETENLDQYEELIKLLKIPKISRTKKEYFKINKYLCNNIEFFKNLSNQIEEPVLRKITGIINYQRLPSEYKIYSYGDDVDKFYFILKGSVKILKPTPVQKSMSFRDYVEYIVNIRDIEKNELKFKRIEGYNPNVSKFKLIELDYDYTKIPPAKEEIFTVEEEKEINILNEGDFFGKILFKKSELRNETVITKEKCDMVYFNRNEYAKLIAIEEQKINNKLSFFRIDYPIFKYWNNSNCLNLVKGGITEKYQKGDFIYKQNDKPDYIYLLKEGVIECYNQTKLDLYESFIEYIHDGENSLLKDIDDPLLWKEDKISQKIIQGYEDLENMRFSLQKLKSEDDDEKDDFINNDNNQEGDDKKRKLVNQMEKINDGIKNYSYRANIQKYSAPQIFGLLEVFELKRRFCSMRCFSQTAIVTKIPMMNFLLSVPTDKKNIFHLQYILCEEKKYLIEQVKNNALAKLTFIKTNALKNKIIKLYNSDKISKGMNNEFKFTKLSTLKNDSIFTLRNSLNALSKNLLRNNSIIKTNRCSIKRNDLINIKKLSGNKIFEDDKNSVMDNFKNTMIKLDKKKFENIRKLYPKSVKNIERNSNSNFNFKSNQTFNKDNNYIKYLENNTKSMNTSNKLPLSVSMSNLVAKSYYNKDNININFFRKRDSSNSNKNVVIKEKLLLLPNIN